MKNEDGIKSEKGLGQEGRQYSPDITLNTLRSTTGADGDGGR